MKLFNNIKLWIIIALVVVLSGSVMIAVFGLNQTVDYKTSYEVSITVDQNVKNAGKIVKTAAEDYFTSIGYKYSSFATEKSADGAEYIYKFNKKGDVVESDLNQALSNALTENEETKDLQLVAKSEYKKVFTSEKSKVGGILAACCLGLLIAFIVALFTVKAAGAFTLLCNAVISPIIFITLLALARIPAYPDFIAASSFAALLSVAATFTVLCGYNEKLKNAKDTTEKIATDVIKSNGIRLCVLCAAGVIVALGLSVTGSIYLAFTGLKILIAVAVAVLVTLVATPVLWTTFKNVKSGK